MCSYTWLKLSFVLERKCFRANIGSTTESDQRVFLKYFIGEHCLIDGCLGAGFHCMKVEQYHSNNPPEL